MSIPNENDAKPEATTETSSAVTTYLSADGLLRVRIARVGAVANEAARRHTLTPYAHHALARAFGAVAVMPLSWKDADRVSVQWAGIGAVGYVIVEARVGGALRGYVKNADAVAPRAYSTTTRPNTIGYDPRGAVAVIKQASSGQHTQGQVALTDGSIDGDLAHWFEKSEQVPTALRVDVRPDEVVGVLVQMLPGEAGASAERSRLPTLDGDISFAQSDGEILAALNVTARVVEKTALKLSCSCSRERMANAMTMLSEQDLLAMLAEDHGATATCDFCAEVYTFSDVELTQFIDARVASKA